MDIYSLISVINTSDKKMCITGPDIMSVFPELVSNKDMIEEFDIRYDEYNANLVSLTKNSQGIRIEALQKDIHPKPSVRNSKNCFDIILDDIP
jgi:hypothetical protein